MMERNHRHILETTKIIKFQGGLLDKSLGLCIKAFVYVLNRVSSTVLNGKSSFEMLYNKIPSLLHLRFIGCLCFAIILTQKDKFNPIAVRVLLVGYSASQKGCKLYGLENRVFFISRNMVFMESVFPFRGSVKDQEAHIIPYNHVSYDDLIVSSDVTTGIDTIIPDKAILRPIHTTHLKFHQ